MGYNKTQIKIKKYIKHKFRLYIAGISAPSSFDVEIDGGRANAPRWEQWLRS